MLVLDANILIRAMLGSKILLLLHKYAGQVDFLAPDTAFQEATSSSISIAGATATLRTKLSPVSASAGAMRTTGRFWRLPSR